MSLHDTFQIQIITDDSLHSIASEQGTKFIVSNMQQGNMTMGSTGLIRELSHPEEASLTEQWNGLLKTQLMLQIGENTGRDGGIFLLSFFETVYPNLPSAGITQMNHHTQ
jgi:hypothetical protein